MVIQLYTTTFMNLKHLFLENDKDPRIIVDVLSNIGWHINVMLDHYYIQGDTSDMPELIRKLKDVETNKIRALGMVVWINREANAHHFETLRQYFHPHLDKPIHQTPTFNDDDEFGGYELHGYEFSVGENRADMVLHPDRQDMMGVACIGDEDSEELELHPEIKAVIAKLYKKYSTIIREINR